MNEDGTVKTVGKLRELLEPQGGTKDKEGTRYCRIGERSSHTWFVLRSLLGHPDLRNSDGSWTEGGTW